MTRDHFEVVVLRDVDGNYYAVPRVVVERYLVPGRQVAALQAMMGDAVVPLPPDGALTLAGIVELPAQGAAPNASGR